MKTKINLPPLFWGYNIIGLRRGLRGLCTEIALTSYVVSYSLCSPLSWVQSPSKPPGSYKYCDDGVIAEELFLCFKDAIVVPWVKEIKRIIIENF